MPHVSAVALLLAQILTVIVASRLMGLVMRRLGQPMVIAEVTAGILLGPSLLGWLAPDAAAALFPATSLPALGALAQLGVALFMFIVGLEFEPSLLRGRAHTSIVISHASIIVPFALGFGLGLGIRDEYAAGAGVEFPLFMGVAMSITAFPVLARILAERDLLKTRIGAVTLACAAVDDVTAWCILAFVVAVTRAAGVEAAVLTTGMALGYVLLVLFVLRPILGKIAARAKTPEGGALPQGVVAVMLAITLASALTTELIGIHALFGAFIIGVVVPKEHGFATALSERLKDPVTVILLPLFFAYSGLRTEIGLLDSGDKWALTGLIIACACVGKFAGSALPARLTGLSWRESSVLGILMNTRGLMELIVLNLGLELGVISPTVFSMMVLMALFTTAITSPLLSLVYPKHRQISEALAAPLPDGRTP